jgi:hypothetical protein
MTFRYSDEEIDKICSLSVEEIEQCTVPLLKKIAVDSGINNAYKMKKDELCKSIKASSSIKSSEKLLIKCDKAIEKVEKIYDPSIHDESAKETIQELRKWFNDKTQKINTIKLSDQPSLFDLTSQYAEINTQCNNLTEGVKNLLKNSRKMRRKVIKNKKPYC